MKRPRQKKVIVHVREDQLEWLKKNKYSLDDIVRTYLEEFIRSMDKTKKGIVIPAMIKAPSDMELIDQIKKNPKLRHLIKD